MAHPTLAQVVRAIRPPKRNRTDASNESDAELLTRFAQTRDDDAFRRLVQRHGPTVLAACRQVLRDPADTDDAFQATFLVLLKKAKRLAADPTPLGGWLYAVAHRVAVRCRSDRHRRTAREAEAARRTRTAAELPDLSWREATDALHEELNGLPDKYRLPLLLCGVRGLTRDEAAEQLGTTVGAVRGQLERARALLERRLAKRGIALAAGWLATVMESSRAAGVPSARLIDLAAGLTGGGSPSHLVALAHGAFPMLPALKPVAVAVAAVALAFGLTVALVSPQPAAHADDKPAMKAEKKAEPKADAKPGEKPAERTIRGTVLGHDGKPLAAELELVWVDAKPMPLGKANADGTFKVTVPMMQGGYGGWLVARAPGHGPDFLRTGFDWQPKTLATTAEATLKLPKERPIQGRILDQQGKPVAGAKVAANTIAAFDSTTSITDHLTTWAKENYNRGASPDGDRSMYFPGERYLRHPNAARSPYTATSDADGRFTIAGLGADQLVFLEICGQGVADKDVITLNRDGFDVQRFNKLAKEYEYKRFSFGGRWQLSGADPTVVLDPEKIIRGRLTDHEGKPRAGVKVAFTRTSQRDLAFGYHVAKTDADGKYEIRGAKKHKGYGVEVDADPAAGLLPCQVFTDDTVGYEPIVLDIQQAKGVIVTGRVTDKSTGRPVPCNLHAQVMDGNPFVEKLPHFRHSASSLNETMRTNKDGHFRVVVIPGRVLLSAGPSKGERGEYKPAVPDPKHQDSFFSADGALMFAAYGGGQGFVQGCWCQVLEAKETDTALTVNAELEPATRTLVKVVDADGKPVTGCKATGVEVIEFARPTAFAGDTITVFNLDIPAPEVKPSIIDQAMKRPKEKPGRLLAVIHVERKLVGTMKLTTADKDPVVTLNKPGTLTGRVVGKDGKPLAGLTVYVNHTRREVTEAHRALTGSVPITTDANGEYRLDGLFPGQEFYLGFARGRQRFGPDWLLMNKYKVTWPGEKRKLNELELEPSKDDE